MTSTQYIGMDVHKERISIAVRNAAGKIVMECAIETKANILLQSIGTRRSFPFMKVMSCRECSAATAQ